MKAVPFGVGPQAIPRDCRGRCRAEEGGAE